MTWLFSDRLLVKRRKAANATIRIYLAAFDLFFNSFLSRGYDFQSLKLPPVPRAIPEILTVDEVRRLLASAALNVRHHAILSLIYSAGLDLSQALRLRIDDVDFVHRLIKVRNSRDEVVRDAILAEQLVSQLRYYLNYYRPSDLLFEGKGGKKLSASVVQKAFKKYLQLAGINKQVSVRSLKYSYVKHVEFYGVPLANVLRELGITNTGSIQVYAQMGISDDSVTFSPLDRILLETSSSRVDVSFLEKSFAELQNKDEKSYLLEAIKCLKANAPRAAVVFAWNAAMRNVQYRCLLHGLEDLNTAIRKHYKNAPRVETIDDFEKIRERTVLEASQTLGIFSKGEKNILVNCLDIRNQCGHPGAYMPDELQVAAFMENLYAIVFSKPSPYPVVTKGLPENNLHNAYLLEEEDDGLPF